MKRNLVEAFLSDSKKIPKGFDTEIFTHELDLLEEKPTSFLVSWVKNKTSYSPFEDSHKTFYPLNKNFSTNALARIEKEFNKYKDAIEVFESNPESIEKLSVIPILGINRETVFVKKMEIDLGIINILIDYSLEQFNFSQLQELIEHKKISKEEKEIEYLKAIKLLEFPDNKYRLAIQSNVLELLLSPFESEISSDENSYYSEPDFYPFSDKHIEKVIEYLTLKLKKAEDLKSLLTEDFAPTLNITLEPKDLQAEIKDSSYFSETTLVPPKEVDVKKKNSITNTSVIKTEGFYTFDLSFDNNKLKMLYQELIKLEIIVTKNCEIDFIIAFNHTFINNPNEINKIEWKSYTDLAVFIDKYVDEYRRWKYAEYLFVCNSSLRMIVHNAKKKTPLEYNKRISVYDNILNKLA